MAHLERSPEKMKALATCLFIAALSCGCTSSIESVLESEGAFQVGPVVDASTHRANLMRDFAAAELYLSERISSLEGSKEEGSKRKLEINRQRLSEAVEARRRHIAIWDEFASKIAPGDVVVWVKKRSPQVRYYLALRGSKVAARSEKEDFSGTIE